MVSWVQFEVQLVEQVLMLRKSVLVVWVLMLVKKVVKKKPFVSNIAGNTGSHSSLLEP